MRKKTRRTRQRVVTRRYRVLAEQAYSVSMERSTTFQVTIAGYPCTAFLRPTHSDPSDQRTRGGGLVHLEFTCDEKDLLRAASLGMHLIENVLAGLGVVGGVPFGIAKFIQVLDLTNKNTTRFLFAVIPEYRHWDQPVTEDQLLSLQGMLAHWDSLKRGDRIRRAATLYGRVLQELEDDLAAFQYGYMGLEALEPALAERQAVEPGAETSTGRCKQCGSEYEKRRTALNGVRAYITGPDHSEWKEAREHEWKTVNDLRHKLFHSLQDLHVLSSKARDALPAVAHFLHDAICCLSHAHVLETPTFKLRRGGGRAVFVGSSKPGIDDSIEECRLLVDSPEVLWRCHAEHQWVPEVSFVNSRSALDIRGSVSWLPVPLSSGSETDLEALRIETG